MRGIWALTLVLGVCTFGCRGPSADSRYRNAQILLRQGRLQEALIEARAGRDTEASWRFRLLEAEILLANRDAKSALEILKFSNGPSNPESRARLRMHQGFAEFLQSNYSESDKALTEASEIAKPLGLPLLEAEIELRRGALEARRDHPASADASIRHALQIAEIHSDRYLQASAMGNLGFLFLNTHRYVEAIYWFDKTRTTFDQLGAANYVALTDGNLGWCYHELGDFDKALIYQAQAEAYFRKAGNLYEQQTWLGNIGLVLYAKDDFPGAAAKFKSALAIAQQLDEKYWTGWWFYNLASVSIELGDFNAAEKYNEEALRLKKSLEDRTDFYPRVNTARIAAGRKNLALAEKLYRDLITESSDDPTPMIYAESGLVDLLVEKGDLDQADAQFRSALALIEHRRTELAGEDYRLTYLSSLIEFYDRYIDFLVTRGQMERALEVAESSRARVLDERLQSKGARSTVTAARLRELAKSTNSVFLSYWLGKKQSHLWVITGGGITIHPLPPQKQITALVEDYRSFIENLRDPLASEYPAGRKLSEALLNPVRAALSSGARIVLVPDRALHSLNFETLPDPENPSQYLIERATLCVAPSLGVLAETRPAQKVLVDAKKSVLLIGDPEQAVEEYPRLPFAGREIEQIGREFPADKQVVLKGADAYPAAYGNASPARFGYVHFAAHATANRESPLDSALILSRHDNGYSLSARDVMNVPLGGSLVTLSACRSAGAKTYSGEGLVGLSWAFLRAGARSVVAGLWDVTDASTASLMTDFYGRMAQNASPLDALREAKRTLLHSNNAYKKPFYWGPFQMYIGTAF